MVEIVETSFVVPSEETPKHSIWLSNIDHINIMDYVPLVYVYRPIGGLDLYSATGPLKQALAKALVHFYPLAGRLELDPNGRCEIACTGDGVLFVVGRYDGSADDFGDFKPSPEMRRLLVPSVESAKPPSAVLLMVQLTFFKCGGVTLGTAVHHQAVDGHSTFHFVRTWADTARGIVNDPPVKPHFDRTLLRARSPPTVLFDQFEYTANPNGPSIPQSPCVSTILKLSRSQVARLKTCGSNGKQLSTFLAVTAHVWRSTCIARGLAAGHMTRLSTPVNFRNRLNPPLPPGFFGNAVCRTSTVADAGEIMSNPLSFAAGIIYDAIDKVNDEYVRSTIDYMELDRSRWKPSNMGSNLLVVSLLGMPTYFGDFGWGKPEFMGLASMLMLSSGCVYLMQSPEDDGGVYVPMTLGSEVMEIFKKVFYKELEVLNTWVPLRGCKRLPKM